MAARPAKHSLGRTEAKLKLGIDRVESERYVGVMVARRKCDHII
jgi:hypothetical protein